MVTDAPYLTLKDQVLRRLREDILSNHYQSEQALNINELCDRYQVSRTPIREALNSLASMGLLSMNNYRSIKVAKFLSDEIYEIYYMRAAISGLSARLAAQHMPDADIEYLRANLEDMQRTIADQNEFLKYNRSFHLKIEEQIKTPIISNLSEQLYIITRRYRELGYEVRCGEDNLREHRCIIEAIAARDPDKADEYGRLHYTKTMELLANQGRK